ncbi:MAG: hypothetical protein J3T61_03365 [Candidatus Brocadiales bacterium]|nr:hypothetical protein [Candidatus Bathyanammoxibius sp.]
MKKLTKKQQDEVELLTAELIDEMSALNQDRNAPTTDQSQRDEITDELSSMDAAIDDLTAQGWTDQYGGYNVQ